MTPVAPPRQEQTDQGQRRDQAKREGNDLLPECRGEHVRIVPPIVDALVAAGLLPVPEQVGLTGEQGDVVEGVRADVFPGLLEEEAGVVDMPLQAGFDAGTLEQIHPIPSRQDADGTVVVRVVAPTVAVVVGGLCWGVRERVIDV